MNDDKRWEQAADLVTEGGVNTPSSPEEQELAQAAAAAVQAMVRPERPPARLRERLRRDAAAWAADQGAQVVPFPAPRAARKSLIFEWFPMNARGWQAVAAVAAAAAVWGMWGGEGPTRPSRSAAASRFAWVREVTDMARADFEPGFAKYAGLTGDVVWSDARQDGFLRLKGIPANDPKSFQYQLWVVDPERDAFPVDGGVFNVEAGPGEAVVHFNPRLPVSKPTAFVITREQPGGVVKSRNAKPVAVAKL